MSKRFRSFSVRALQHITLSTIVACFVTTVCIAQTPLPPDHFSTVIKPFLENHCTACHSGEGAEAGIDFERYDKSSKIQTDFDHWEKVLRLIKERQMPPAEETQPTADELLAIVNAIQAELDSFDCSTARHPGRVTIRRLNRAEYNNTIRDLLKLDLQLAKDFPSDDVGEGFDNIGDVLTIPPLLMEKYLAAAQTIAKAVQQNEVARKIVLPEEAENDSETVAVIRRNLRQFASKAWRRPVTDEEEQRVFALVQAAYESGAENDEIFVTVVSAILSHPNFLFRIERDPTPDDEDGIRALDGYELATRLSYFLWSSMPDQELFDAAADGSLTQPAVLESQAIRMLHDPKAQALVNNFAGQWLQLRDVDRLQPDPEMFAAFDDELRHAMKRETEVFFETMMREDRSVLEFLTADFTYVNARLAKHYGIDGVKGEQFQKVAAPPGRRGVLTHAGILMLTSNPTRTSPVKRGKWVLENILAEPPPPPPPDVPELEEGTETLGSLREQMEQHRSNPACAVCHVKMDAIGFGMENFDAVGAWRERDGRFEVDASGELPGGRSFDGAADLMQILADQKKTEFLRCLSRKMLVYALGRGLTTYDRCAINEIVSSLEANEYRFSKMVTSIVLSDPFRFRERVSD
ncbi:MAG: hypothetical protein Fues2KO_36750 [Fuerstiella sp.]